MKRNFMIIAFTALLLGLCCMSCEKETNTTENTSPTLKNLKISDIKVQDGMLCFESIEQYESTIIALANACEEYTAHYMDSIVKILGTDDDNIINEQIEKDGFSQFKPLHEFADALHFQSMFNKLENAEKAWMNNPSGCNPFEDSELELYQSALHNENGDVLIGWQKFNPIKDEDDDCKRKGKNSCCSDTISSGDIKCFFTGQIKTTAISFSANTHSYKIKNGKTKSYYCKGLSVSDSGNKISICDYDYQPMHLVRMDGDSKYRPNIRLCYVSVYETITSQPNFIYQYDKWLHSGHGCGSMNVVHCHL